MVENVMYFLQRASGSSAVSCAALPRWGKLQCSGADFCPRKGCGTGSDVAQLASRHNGVGYLRASPSSLCTLKPQGRESGE